MEIFNNLPASVLQWFAIFISIIIEALPFVLLGTIPSYTAVPFLATAPIINPIVLFATYSAFGNSWRFLGLRLLGAIIVAITLGIMLGFVVDENILKENAKPTHFHDYSGETWYRKIFLALVASGMQIYLPTRILTRIGGNALTAILVMMLLAFILSLCSEADAFIGASLLSSFGTAPVLAFLLIGPMVDIKNLMMMVNSFKPRFIVQFITVSVGMIIIYCLLVGVI